VLSRKALADTEHQWATGSAILLGEVIVRQLAFDLAATSARLLPHG
jgi:hypothetical protein